MSQKHVVFRADTAPSSPNALRETKMKTARLAIQEPTKPRRTLEDEIAAQRVALKDHPERLKQLDKIAEVINARSSRLNPDREVPQRTASSEVARPRKDGKRS